MQNQPSKWTIAFGGMIGAAIALLGILIGSSIARMVVADHAGAPHAESASE